MSLPVTSTPDLQTIPAAVDGVLWDFLAAKAGAENETPLAEFVGVLRDFLAGGGKRLRPVLCCCGWLAAGGGDPAPVLPAAASLELFHTFALIHDDVMDRSDTRRERPTVHRRLAAGARCLPHLPDAERFGSNSAILLGDLAMVWSDELLYAADPPPGRLAAARAVLNGMRSELMYGQYLDLLGNGDFDGGLDAALTVVRYKTAKYTVERPLQLGAALAGGGAPVLDACTAYGIPVGEAFQLRDDVLGVFGDTEVTGKSCLGDLREGKHTALLAIAVRQADAAQTRTLRALVGDPELDEEGAAEVRAVFRRTGALEAVEHMIAQRRGHAVRVLDRSPFPPGVRAVLHRLATVATARSS